MQLHDDGCNSTTTDATSVSAVATIDRFGSLSGLVNNAGIIETAELEARGARAVGGNEASGLG
ncbi:MAG: NAD(P)-dependent dehydrogenase (short-subunit alcohol dehydrogenase family) [Ilumatobacter sp.]|jgi:NAD(P)-dependent dehydrogenase (short-subunit alcohol dehydrogenase family)